MVEIPHAIKPVNRNHKILYIEGVSAQKQKLGYIDVKGLISQERFDTIDKASIWLEKNKKHPYVDLYYTYQESVLDDKVKCIRKDTFYQPLFFKEE